MDGPAQAVCPSYLKKGRVRLWLEALSCCCNATLHARVVHVRCIKIQLGEEDGRVTALGNDL